MATSKSPKKAKSKKTKEAGADNKKLSALDAAAKVLAETGQPMSCKELIEAMAQKGYWSPQRQDAFVHSLFRDDQRDRHQGERIPLPEDRPGPFRSNLTLSTRRLPYSGTTSFRRQPLSRSRKRSQFGNRSRAMGRAPGSRPRWHRGHGEGLGAGGENGIVKLC